MIANVGALIKSLEQKHISEKIADFRVGDTVRMKIKVREGDKERLHPFEGTVIRKTGRGLKGTFTVRKVSFGEGVEKTFPIHSPVIAQLDIVSRGDIKQARLYYLRERTGKSARVKTKVE